MGKVRAAKFLFSKKNLRVLIAVLSLVSLYILGYQMAQKSWNNEISISVNDSSRGLAENTPRQLASVSHEEYSNPQTVFKKAKITQQDSMVDFLIGNILIADSKGNKNFVCQNYSQVHLFFIADISIENERVIMEIAGDCKQNSDHEFIGPFSIPFEEILHSPVQDSSFTATHSQIYFSNIAISWPRAWILQEVHFKNDSGISKTIKAAPPQTEEDLFIIEL